MTETSTADGKTITGIPDERFEQRGYGSPQMNWLREKHPAYEEVRRKLSSAVYTPIETELPLKYREIISAVVLATKAYPSIEMHLRRAVTLGASIQELIEAMETAALPGGSPTLHFALPYLIKIDEEMRRESAANTTTPAG